MPTRKHPEFLTCEYCQKLWRPRAPMGRYGLRRFCSIDCYEKSRELPVAVCKTCGKEFKAKAFHGRQRYCSKACTIGVRRAKRIQITCERCKKIFEVYENRKKHGNPRFCSKECAGNIRRSENERFHRLQTRTWRDIRNEVMLRDGRVCKKCGAVEQLTVHHIVPWAESKDDSPENLITLCRSCHYSIEWFGDPLP